MRSRKLVLRKETLSELDTDELGRVVGASDACVTFTIVLTGCQCSGIYPSLNVNCPTLDPRCQHG
ncbi:MAG TPA: class I lanthipeptide [Mycobacteriales bacterium]|nr:class I lanthipeptide [Mycobacteriales bacterium]